MRIALDGRYIQDHFPGIGRYTYNLVRHLAALGDDPLVVFHNPALRNSHHDVAALARTGNVTMVPLAVPTFSLGEQWCVPLAALRHRSDLLHTPYYVKPYLPPLPSVTTVYDTIPALHPEYLPSRRARWIFAITTRLALATSRLVLTISKCAREDLVRLYGVRPEKVVVTYLAADERYRPLERESCLPLRQRLGLPPRFALYVGINKPHKNLVRLIETLALARRQAGVHLVIAGAYDPRWPQAREAVSRLGLDSSVTFLPNVPEADLPLLYNLADCFVFPSLYEGFGLPPLEAMACGVPVLCSNRSALLEVVGDAAVSLDPLDVPAWAAALCDLWESPSRRDFLAESGVRRAVQFTWERTARETLDAYREALRS